MTRRAIASVAAAFLLVAMGCQEEGPAERAGRQVDEAAEEAREETEGTLERLGREVDEAAKETREAADEVQEAVEEASE